MEVEGAPRVYAGFLKGPGKSNNILNFTINFIILLRYSDRLSPISLNSIIIFWL
ncbi:hypothetical protein PEDI_52910 [Persicobacter diffluens]|uniref:Uncharacterized protein n=1 Tax=Persicobacter diffluens TaxID=981 RepID=A0AAN4W2W5_9BACT|nr:hypothetical protein PEDI_52910 [Persicobacter diffluens]